MLERSSWLVDPCAHRKLNGCCVPHHLNNQKRILLDFDNFDKAMGSGIVGSEMCWPLLGAAKCFKGDSEGVALFRP